MLLSWVLFPIVLALLCAGWGVLLTDALGVQLDGALLVPFGLAAVIVASGLLTAWPVIAPADVPVTTGVAAVGLVRLGLRLRRRPDFHPAGFVAAIATLLAFGAPVILSGSATFAGYLKLDDTATWLSIVDRVTTHGRSLAGLPPSTYALNLQSYLHTTGYPIGSFLPLGIGRALTGVDAAWVLQPYLAFCAAMVALALYSMARPLVPSRWLRAALACVAAQSALLYGYSQWGGVKELAGAALLALLGPVTAAALRARGRRETGRAAVVAAVAAAAVADTLGPGAGAWVAPALIVICAGWLWRERHDREEPPAGAVNLALLLGTAAILMLPVWLELGPFLHGSNALGAPSGSGAQTALASLIHPLSVLQLGGPWPVGDFRYSAPGAATAPLLAAVLAGLGLWVAHWMRRKRRQDGLALYAAVAVGGTLLVWLGGAIPWDVAKALAMAAPAVPALALAGAAAWLRTQGTARLAAATLLAVIAGGILWSNVRQYHNVTLAPRERLAELQQIAPLIRGRGPTLINEYDPYADRHFLREGAPTEPAEYRPYRLPLRDGTLLTQSAATDLDALSPTALLGFPSIVTRTDPLGSRPPSSYRLRWRGRFYELWQRPLRPSTQVLDHVPFGDSSIHPFCGRSTTGSASLCPIQPVASAPCPLVQALARTASVENAQLLAAERPAPIVARADQSRWPAAWIHDSAAGTLGPTTPGTVIFRIRLASTQRYSLWIGGSLTRELEVVVDGRRAGRVQDQLSNIGEVIPAGTLALTAGVHTIALRYPPAGAGPGAGAQMSQLWALALQPLEPSRSQLIAVAPNRARVLCGQPLDWIDLTLGAS